MEPIISAGVGVSLVVVVEPYWMDPIISFLAEDRVSTDKKEAEKVRRTAIRFGCLQIVSCIEDLLTGHTCSACTLARLRNS